MAPHLYNIFMFDFPHLRDDSTGLLYADDSLLYSHDESPIDALRKVSRHLSIVNDFYERWGVSVNASKCEAVCIRNASGKCRGFVVPESRLLRLFLSGLEIHFRDSVRYLGVRFDKLLKFNKHARTALQKSYRILGAFSKILGNKYLPTKTKLLLYKTAIRPVLLYGFPIWFNISPTVMDEMEIMERKILRFGIGKNFRSSGKRYSNRYIYDESGIVPIGIYACYCLERFITRVCCHENRYIRDVSAAQAGFSWSNTNYLSPLGYLYEENSTSSVSLRPEFYNKRLVGTHRG